MAPGKGDHSRPAKHRRILSIDVQPPARPRLNIQKHDLYCLQEFLRWSDPRRGWTPEHFRMSPQSATLEAQPTEAEPFDSPAAQESPDRVDRPAGDSGGCPNCGSLEPWGRSSWCPQCGFYPRLGISIGPALEVREPGPKSPIEAWRQFPGWGRVLCAGVAAIIIASFAVRFATPEKSSIRSHWAVGQLALGALLFSAMHAVAFVKAAMSASHLGFIDSLLHPVMIWESTIQELPKTARRVWLAAWGLTAAVGAIAIVGGIRYAALLDDWGFMNRADSAMTSRVRMTSVEKLVGDGVLAGDLDSAVQERAEKEAKLAEEAARQGTDLDMRSTDCVVVGYNVNPRDGKLSELLLASLVDGELQDVGSVTKGIPDDVRETLSAKLPDLKRNTPFVHCSGTGVWVKPVVTCKASFKSWTDQKLMADAVFTELLAEVDGVK